MKSYNFSLAEEGLFQSIRPPSKHLETSAGVVHEVSGVFAMWMNLVSA